MFGWFSKLAAGNEPRGTPPASVARRKLVVRHRKRVLAERGVRSAGLAPAEAGPRPKPAEHVPVAPGPGPAATGLCPVVTSPSPSRREAAKSWQS